MTKTGKKKINLKKTEIIKNYQYYLMALPAIIIYFLFAYLPLPGVILAFKQYDINGGIFGSKFVGLDNFKSFFTGADIGRVTRNILLINGGNIIFGMFFSVLAAVLINELFSNRMKKIYQNILFLPTFFSAILVSKFFNLILDNNYGILNSLMKISGFNPVMWYDKPWLWIPIIIFANIWKGLGNGLIIYLASIIAIDEEQFEAAKIDGATRFQQITKIILPSLKPIIILQFLLNIGRIFGGDFLFIFSFINDNYKLKETLDIIETYLFAQVVGTGDVDYGMSTAINLYQTVLGFIVVFSCNFIVRKVDKDNALF